LSVDLKTVLGGDGTACGQPIVELELGHGALVLKLDAERPGVLVKNLVEVLSKSRIRWDALAGLGCEKLTALSTFHDLCSPWSV